MKKILIITFLLISTLFFSSYGEAASRPELLALCSAKAKRILKNNYFASGTTAVQLMGLTTWLSAENSTPPQQFKFSHIAKVRRQDAKLMHWYFHSITEVRGNSCTLLQQVKTSERELPLPEDCDNCDDNQD